MAEMGKKAPLVFCSLGERAVTAGLRNHDGSGFEPGFWLPLVRHLETSPFPGFLEAVAGIHTATIYYDPYLLYRGLDRISSLWPELADFRPENLQEVVCRLLELEWAKVQEQPDIMSRLMEIPVQYGGQWGPDLEEAASLCGLAPAEWIRLHSGAEYRVLMVGFVPGFPYLDGLPEQLAVSRLATPRLRVPAGSVAVGGSQTGIYPLESPGGWRVVGWTPISLFRPGREEPSLLRAGDRVKFVPVEKEPI
ncbi:MAG: kinase inhibitor [Paenibacillaceae bacterium]|jgi:inhibitor of KinA|nr:kinase inhibitor [Paenibacillaceae bacterium]